MPEVKSKKYPIYPWREPERIRAPAFAVTDDVYYVGNRNVSCHLVRTTAGLILIDTAFAQTSRLLIESIRSLGFAPDEIKILLHSHGHVDHCGATRRMKELTGAITALAEADRETVEKGTPLTCAEYIYGIREFETFTVDRALRHGDRVELDGKVIACHHTPGHTPGVMTFTFPTTVKGKSVVAGLFGGPGLWTLMDEHRERQGYPGNREDFARSLAYLRRLPIDVWLGAHPDQNDTFGKYERLRKQENPHPFIDPDGWRKFIARLEDNLRRLLSREKKR